MLAPTSVVAESAVTDKFATGEPFTQEFVLTAYYSPKANQCCYVTGSYEDDITLNGQGTNGADGTEVYPGMIAAPASYPFGTRVKLPGLGIFTVHDRGGAIVEQGDAHRIDVWAGEGEDGLARALAFGVKRIKGTVYPKGSEMPEEAFDLASLPAPLERLKPYAVGEQTLLSVAPKLGDRGASVQALQDKLKALGYFNDASTGLFGPVTQGALRGFLAHIGSTEPDDRLTEHTAALLEASALRASAPEPIAERIVPGSPIMEVAALQRTMRFLDLYKGRSNGVFNDALRESLMTLQKENRLIGDASSPGAGTVGPKTRAVILQLWRAKHVRMLAEKLEENHRINTYLADTGIDPGRHLTKGSSGTAVRALQRFLAAEGFFPKEKINGNYGDLTQASVLAYQKAKNIVKGNTDTGAGQVGPTTLESIRSALRSKVRTAVRSGGWETVGSVL